MRSDEEVNLAFANETTRILQERIDNAIAWLEPLARDDWRGNKPLYIDRAQCAIAILKGSA